MWVSWIEKTERTGLKPHERLWESRIEKKEMTEFDALRKDCGKAGLKRQKGPG